MLSLFSFLNWPGANLQLFARHCGAEMGQHSIMKGTKIVQVPFFIYFYLPYCIVDSVLSVLRYGTSGDSLASGACGSATVEESTLSCEFVGTAMSSRWPLWPHVAYLASWVRWDPGNLNEHHTHTHAIHCLFNSLHVVFFLSLQNCKRLNI